MMRKNLKIYFVDFGAPRSTFKRTIFVYLLVPLVGNDSGGFIIQKESIQVQFQETLQLKISLRNLVQGDSLLSFDVYLNTSSGTQEKVSL